MSGGGCVSGLKNNMSSAALLILRELAGGEDLNPEIRFRGTRYKDKPSSSGIYFS
jgi:hypothetical protein